MGEDAVVGRRGQAGAGTERGPDAMDAEVKCDVGTHSDPPLIAVHWFQNPPATSTR